MKIRRFSNFSLETKLKVRRFLEKIPKNEPSTFQSDRLNKLQEAAIGRLICHQQMLTTQLDNGSKEQQENFIVQTKRELAIINSIIEYRTGKKKNFLRLTDLFCSLVYG